MKILVGIWHPAHVHTFRNVIKDLQNKGHKFKILAIDKDIVTELLDLYDIDYEIIGKSPENLLIKKVKELIKLQSRILKKANKFEPNLLLSRSISPMLPVKKLHDVPLIIFDDDDITSPITKFLFTDYLFTPINHEGYVKNKMHIRLPTYKELAYIHPNNFKPNKSSLIDLGIIPDEKYSVIRFSAWDAWHDTGKKGFNKNQKIDLVEKLDTYSQVFITSEGELPPFLRKYKLNIPKHKIHDLLYYSDLYIGDSQTMASEASLMGVPSIRCNTFVREGDLCYLKELSEKYNLICNIGSPEKAIARAVKLIQNPNLKQGWLQKREKVLEDKIDLSSFLIWFIDNHPRSVSLLEENKNYYQEIVEKNE